MLTKKEVTNMQTQEVKKGWEAPQVLVHGNIEELTQDICQDKKNVRSDDLFGFTSIGDPFECS